MTETTPWMTRSEAAEYARVTVDTIDRWADAGELPRYGVRGTRSVRFRRDEIDALMQPTTPAAEK